MGERCTGLNNGLVTNGALAKCACRATSGAGANAACGLTTAGAAATSGAGAMSGAGATNGVAMAWFTVCALYDDAYGTIPPNTADTTADKITNI